MKDKFSFAKDEKVVNPPQKPTVVKSISEDPFSELFRKKYPESRPINKQPSKLTQKVFHGKPLPE